MRSLPYFRLAGYVNIALDPDAGWGRPVRIAGMQVIARITIAPFSDR